MEGEYTAHMKAIAEQLAIANDAAARMMDGLERSDWHYVSGQLARQMIALGNAKFNVDTLELLAEHDGNVR